MKNSNSSDRFHAEASIWKTLSNNHKTRISLPQELFTFIKEGVRLLSEGHQTLCGPYIKCLKSWDDS